MRTLLLILLLPALALAQTPRENVQRVPKTNTIIGSALSVPVQVQSIAALRAVTVGNVTDGQKVDVVCYATIGDGGGGQFYYSSGSAVADNGGTVIAPTSGSGRWLRVIAGVYSVRWFGATGNGSTNDSAAVVAAFAATSGGDILFPKGTYKLDGTETIEVQDGTWIDMDGSSLSVNEFATSQDVLFDMGSNTALRNGTITVVVASPPANGERNIPVRVSHYTSATAADGESNILIEDVVFECSGIWTNANAIAVFGQSTDISIKRVVFNGGSKLGRGILVHWAGNAGLTETYHPSRISISNVSSENLYSASDCYAVFLSASSLVSVENVWHSGQGGALKNFAGDYGASLAATPEGVGYGFLFKNVSATDATLDVVGVVGAPAISGAALPMQGTIINPFGIGVGAASVLGGVQTNTVDGITIIGGNVSAYLFGLTIGKDSHNVNVTGGVYEGTQKSGIRVGNQANPALNKPSGVVIDSVIVRNSDVGGAATLNDRALINIDGAVDCRISKCTLGLTAAEPAIYGIRASAETLRPVVDGCRVQNLTAGGAAYSFGSTTDYVIEPYLNNSTADGGVTYRGGTIPAQSYSGASRSYSGSGVPAAGLGADGDYYYRTNGGTGTSLYYKSGGNWAPAF